jgi:hypothetical protein
MFGLFGFTPQTSGETITLTVLVCDLAAYFLFYYVTIIGNRMRTHDFAAPRLIGCVGLGLVTILLVMYAKTSLVDTQAFAALPAYEQGEYYGRIMRKVVLPALIIAAVVAAHGWRDARARKYGNKDRPR